MRLNVNKSWICLALALIVAIGLLQPMGSVSVYAEAGTVAPLFEDTFESQDDGQAPAGWVIPGKPSAADPETDPFVLDTIVVELDNEAGKVLKFEQNAKTSASYSIRREIADATPKVLFTYKFRADQSNTTVYLPSLQYGSQIKFALISGQIQYMKQNETKWTPIKPYQAGQWHDVRIMLDSENGVFDLYMDDIQLLSNEQGGQGTPLASFYLGMYKDSVGTVYYDDFYIHAYKPAASVSFGQAEYDLNEGESRTLELMFEPADATVQSAHWHSSDTTIAQVSSTGVVTGVSAGTAMITAHPAEQGLSSVTAIVRVHAAARTVGDVLNETFEGVSAGAQPPGWTLPGKPTPAPPAPDPFILQASVELTPGSDEKALRFVKNAKTAASYSITRPVTATTTKMLMTYKVRAEQNDAVVYLPSLQNGSQLKFALNGGQFTYMKEGASAWTNIHPYVSGEWHEVKIMLDADAGEFDLYIDGRLELSREPGGAGGALTSFYLGMYKDSVGTVYFDDFNIYSYKPAASVAFTEESYDLAQDRSIQLPLVFEPLDATVQSAVWSSSDPDVATVSNSGVVTGLQTGTALITAQPYEDVAAVTAAVYVYSIPWTSITLDPVSAPVPQGSRLLLAAKTEPENGTDQRLVWGSEDSSVATVDRYGEMTAVGEGTTKVYAANSDGTLRGETTVTVVPRTVQHELYVSLDGDDGGAGTILDPFRTLARAQSQVREWNEEMSGDIIVNLRGGTYILEEGLEWGAEDSGQNGYFITYRSFPGERAILSGGRSIGNWVEHDAVNGIYKSSVGTGLETRQLFVDGVRAVRARSEGGLSMPMKTATGYITNDVEFADWSRISDLEFVYHEQWTNSRAGVDSVEIVGDKAHIRMKEPAWTAVSDKGMTSASVPVYYENAYELLDQPGEWYYDRAAGALYYKPRAWEDLSTAEVIAPVLERMVTISGDSADNPVRNLQFEQLSFMYTTWMRPSSDAGHADAQNNHLRYPGSPDQLPESAIRVEQANSVSFIGNEFAKLGITAIRMENGVQNSLIEGNRFYDLSGGAVNIGSPDSNDRNVFHPEDHRMIMKNNDILNNIIHDIGVDYKSSSAVSAGYPVDMDISHNEMFSLPYSGTHTGYGWAKDFDPVTENMKIQNNLIYDLMGMGLYDGGAIYSLGTTGATAAEKNLVSGNYIRNQMNIGAPLYTDEGSAYWKFEHNVIDLIDSGEWHSSKRWAQIWASSIHDIDFVNNYTTEPQAISNGYDNLFDNNQVFGDADWPVEALDIIERSGVQPGKGPEAATSVRRWGIEPMILAVGGTGPVQLRATDGKDVPMTLEGSDFYYEIDQPEIAAVDAQGIVTGIATGYAKLTVYIVNGTILRTLHTDLYIGDKLTEVHVEGSAGRTAFMTEGTTKALHTIGVTEFGNQTTLDRVSFRTGNPSIATVTADGIISAVAAGDTVLTIYGEFQGIKVETHYLLRIIAPGVIHDYPLHEEMKDANNWHVSPTSIHNIQLEEESITVSTPSGGHTVYQGRMYGNELLDADLQINGDGGWYALMLGKQSNTAGYVNDDNYIIVVSSSAIELHRYNNGKRTVIYGNLDGYESLGGDAIPNTMLPYNSRHRVQAGTFLHEDGVRVVMKIDGATVFDYLDTAAEALDNPGYFGLIARTGSITLFESAQTSDIAALSIDMLKEAVAGQSEQLAVRALYSDGSGRLMDSAELEFASSNEAIASISVDGLLTMKRAGTVEITADYGGLKALYVLIVSGSGEVSSPSGLWMPGGLVSEPYVFDLKRDAEVIIEKGADGRLTKRAVVDPAALVKAFGAAEQNERVWIRIPGSEAVIQVEIPAAALLEAAEVNNNSMIHIETDNAGYRLPVRLLRDLPHDSLITLTIAIKDGVYAENWKQEVRNQGMKPLVNSPVEFTLRVDGKEASDFGNVYVERSIQLNEKADSASATALRIDEHGQFRFAPHRFASTDDSAEVLIYSPHNSVYAVVGYRASFADMDGHWAYNEVEALASKLIVNGKDPERFSPDANITRAEFATMLVRTLGLTDKREKALFSDTDRSAWYAGSLSAAAEAGLINGFEDGTFRPNAYVTREQMAVMISGALAFIGADAISDGSVLQAFKDVNRISDWAREASAIAVSAGLIRGMADETFLGQAYATRAQSAVMLKRLLELLEFN